MEITAQCFFGKSSAEQEALIAQAMAEYSGSTFSINCAAGDPAQARYAFYAAIYRLAEANPNLGSNTVVTTTPTTGNTILAPTFAVGGNSATNYLTPAGTLATLTYRLPAAADSHVGMVRRIATTQTITALTVNVVGGGTIIGTALTTLAANATASYQCVSVAGAGTWLRLS